MPRIRHRAIASVGVIAIPISMQAVGCFAYESDSSLNFDGVKGLCTPGPGVECNEVDGGGGTGGTIDPGCVPGDGGLEDSCGIFVSSSLGSDTNPGTMMDPVATITKAIELASAAGKPAYACAEQFDEGVIVTTSAYVYGGLDCANGWAYIGDTQKTTLTTVADAIPLKLESGISVTVQDVHVLAKDATAQDTTTGHGGSSIAVIADGTTATFVGCMIEAGDGAAGAAGEPYMATAQTGTDGNAGGAACSADVVVGSNGPTNTCGNTPSIGGRGGLGDTSTGGPGSPGEPQGIMNGGAGEPSMNGTCTLGTPGSDGGDGTLGPHGTGRGNINAIGYTGVPGSDGTAGGPGQGGGGGGGAKGGSGTNKCPNVAMAGGASGGSGASGGCGGLGGRGGKPGGASIAVVSIDATLTFEGVTAVLAKTEVREGPWEVPVEPCPWV
jgi:hypothetical protein